MTVAGFSFLIALFCFVFSSPGRTPWLGWRRRPRLEIEQRVVRRRRACSSARDRGRGPRPWEQRCTARRTHACIPCATTRGPLELAYFLGAPDLPRVLRHVAALRPIADAALSAPSTNYHPVRSSRVGGKWMLQEKQRCTFKMLGLALPKRAKLCKGNSSVKRLEQTALSLRHAKPTVTTCTEAPVPDQLSVKRDHS